MAKETLVLRRAGISPALWLLVPTFSLLAAPELLTLLLQCRQERSPTAPPSRKTRKPSVSVLRLAPIIFGAESLSE